MMDPTPAPETVVCVGDSITRGQVSVDYVELLRQQCSPPQYAFVNAGLNYDLSESVRNRLDAVLALEPSVITILIGSNDANSTLSRSNLRLLRLVKRPRATPSLELYRDNLTAIVRALKERTEARIALLSLPVIGEELESTPLRRATEYSSIVREVASVNDVAYLPLHEQQVAYLQDQAQQPGTRYRPGLRLSSTASIQHFILRRSFDDISKRRGLRLTTDTLHQNSRGADMIAELIYGFLTQRPGTPRPSSP